MEQSTQRINVLVTGGAGSVGSNLCEFLLSKELYNVICVDDYSSGHEANIDRFLSHPHFEFIRHDLKEPLDFKAIPGLDRFKVAHVGVQEIYHLAGPDSPAAYLKKPIDVMMLAVNGTKHILDLALATRAKVLFASDTDVAGEPLDAALISEDAHGPLDFLAGTNILAQSKRSAETLVQLYAREYSLETKVVRLHNVFGPNMHYGDGRFIPTAIECALKGEPIVVPQSFERSSFLYVSDAVDALEKIMNLDSSGVYNLAHPTLYTIDEIVSAILRITGSSSTLERGEPTGERALFSTVWQRQSRGVSIARMKDEAGWFPVVLLEQGLEKTITYMKSIRGLADLRTEQEPHH